MIKAADIIAHMKAGGLERGGDAPHGLFYNIGTASDFVLAGDQLQGSPSAFVLPSAKRAGPTKALVQVIDQKIVVQFTILIGFARAGATGGDRIGDIEAVEEQLIDALVGWQPDGVSDPFVYGGGRLVGIDTENQIIFWGSDFVASYHLRK